MVRPINVPAPTGTRPGVQLYASRRMAYAPEAAKTTIPNTMASSKEAMIEIVSYMAASKATLK